MNIRRAYKTELDPNAAQVSHFLRSAGAARWAWNQALAVNQRYYRETGVSLTYARMNRLLTTWKQHPCNAWTYEVSNYCFQSALQDLTRAFVNFFEKRARYPRFKSRHGRKSFRVYGSVLVADDRRVKLPKIGWVRLKERGYIPVGVAPVSCVISEQAGRWYVSFQIDEEHERGEATGDPVGVDLGLTDLACTSDGRRWAGPKALAAAQRKLAHVQRKLARQTKGSGRREDTKQQVARLHREIGNVRGNALHELTSELVGVGLPPEQRPSVLVIEDLRVANMLGNKHLARHISDASWAEIRRQLTYKCEWWGVTLVVVNAAYTSQTCSACGCISADNREGKRFACSECGFSADADVNAAINIRERGLTDLAGKAPERLNARGGHGKSSRRVAARGSVKRESARAAVAAGNDAGSVQGDCWRESVTQTVAPGAMPGHSCATGGA